MLEGNDIICFANDWDGDPLSKKHIALRLARKNRVLWVNSTGNRNPTASVRDVRRAWMKLRHFFRGAGRWPRTSSCSHRSSFHFTATGWQDG